MSRLSLPLTALIAAYVLFFGYIAVTYGGLPAKVASHFDSNGLPDGWMSRGECDGIMVVAALIVPGIVIGTMGSAGRIPVSFINLPHRDYWLAADRRKAALRVLLRYSIWFAAFNVLFLTGLDWLTVQANTPGVARLNMPDFDILLGAYFAATAIWTILLLRHFSKIR